MALVLKDRVRETSTTTGTGTFTLAGAVAGFQSFSAIGTGNSTYYTIVSTSDWEVGIGTWTSPDQLSRDTVLASTNAGALVTFGSGTKDVFLTFPAEGFAVPPAIGGTTPNTITGTTVSATTQITLPGVTVGNVGFGVLQMVDGLDGYDYLHISSDDSSGIPQSVYFDDSVVAVGGVTGASITGTQYNVNGDGVNSGEVRIFEESNTYSVILTVPTTLATNYNFVLPSTTGSNNQVLKTDGSGNLSWTDKFVLGAGTVTAGTAPLKFTSGTNLTTAEAGAMEYNGTTLFSTGIAASGRGVVLSPTMVRLNANRNKATNNTTLEAIFDPANDALALAANTLYYFKGMYIITTAASGTAAGVQVGFLFSNAQQDIGYRTLGHLNTTGTGQNTSYNTVATAVTTTVTNTTAATYCIEVEGWFKSNATTGGTITPAFTQSVVGTSAAPIANANSWIMIQPMSSNISATLIAGNWS